MNISLRLALIPALCMSLFATATHAKDINKSYPIIKKGELYCVDFGTNEPICTQTKSELTQEASTEQYQELLEIKRLHKNNSLNRAIIDAFVDSRMNTLEFFYIKDFAKNLTPPKAVVAAKNSK